LPDDSGDDGAESNVGHGAGEVGDETVIAFDETGEHAFFVFARTRALGH
jgi:hypothetical protein